MRALFRRQHGSDGVGTGVAFGRAALAFLVLNTLLTFENRWPGFGVMYMPRLSFELCLGLALLALWVAWRGAPSPCQASALALGFLALVLVRYADVTAPAMMGRPVNIYWDGPHAFAALQLWLADWPAWRVALALLVGVLGAVLLVGLVRSALLALAQTLRYPAWRAAVLVAVAGLSASFVAHVPDVRDTRWFFSLPLTPSLVQQAQLLAQVARDDRGGSALGSGPAFDTDLSALDDGQGPADVLLLFAESYGAITLDDPVQREALQASRQRLQEAIEASGRQIVSARVRAATFGGASWRSHASLLSGIDASEPGDYRLLLTTQRPTLVRHFARQGYRTVGWMPGLKRPWPEGRFYGFDRLADDPAIGYTGPDIGFWRIPDHAAMDQLLKQEIGADGRERPPVFAVFPTVSTHAPFEPLPTLDGASDPTPQAAVTTPTERYLRSLRYQFEWLARSLEGPLPRRLVLIVIGDHQPPLVAGPGASWDVPVHVITASPELRRRFEGLGFVPGMIPAADSLGDMASLTRVLLHAFDDRLGADLGLAGQGSAPVLAPPPIAPAGPAS